MATSSSNKMPLLVDRPLHSFATIGGTAALTAATNFNTPAPAGFTVLVDCSGNDGAVPGYLYNFDTSTTDADPGSGDIRFNN